MRFAIFLHHLQQLQIFSLVHVRVRTLQANALQDALAPGYVVWQDERPAGTSFAVPRALTDLDSLKTCAETFPAQDRPQMFGLHSNADLTCRSLQVSTTHTLDGEILYLCHSQVFCATHQVQASLDTMLITMPDHQCIGFDDANAASSAEMIRGFLVKASGNANLYLGSVIVITDELRK